MILIKEEIATKICSCCGKIKSVDEFHSNTNEKDGLQLKCKDCAKLYRQKRKKTNRIRRKIEDIEYLPKEKKCSKCEIIKPQSEFYLKQSSIDGLGDWCSECDKESSRKTNLESKYGINQVQYDLMLKSQNGICKMCGKTPKENKQSLSVDHNHKTGKIRGLLCTNCNRGIGLLQDDPELLRIGADYLDKDQP